jgi:hypothetical protein
LIDTSHGTPKGTQVAGLADQIKSERTGVGGRKRRIPQVLAMLDEADQKDLIAALDDPNIQGVAIQRALAKRGITLSATAISTYRTGDHVTI